MKLVPDHIESLAPYNPGPGADELRRIHGVQQVAELANNENPLGPSPLAVRAMQHHLEQSHRYSTGGLDLRRALADRFGLGLENVIVGSGSEGILLGILRAFLCDGDEVLTTEAAFIGFQILAKSCGARYRTVPYKDWGYDLDAILNAVGARTKIVYLANPNNPTGTMFDRKDLERFIRSVPERVLVVMDEAYFEYAAVNPEYPDSLSGQRRNVITLRTFSKVYGLAGLRVGYGFADGRLVVPLLKLKPAFEPNALAQVAGMAALEDGSFVTRSVEHNFSARQTLADALRRLALTVVRSEANFLMVVLPDARRASWITQRLLEAGVMTRYLKGTGLPDCIRITVGTVWENELCARALAAILSADRAGSEPRAGDPS